MKVTVFVHEGETLKHLADDVLHHGFAEVLLSARGVKQGGYWWVMEQGFSGGGLVYIVYEVMFFCECVFVFM